METHDQAAPACFALLWDTIDPDCQRCLLLDKCGEVYRGENVIPLRRKEKK